MKDAFVETEHGQIRYEHGGTGKPLILLHSLGRSTRSYRDVLPILAESFSVYAIDTLGHGGSSKPKRDYLISDFADSVAGFLAALKVPKAMVIGNSIGATIGLDLAARHPAMVEKLVLVGCPAWTTEAEKEERFELHRKQLDAQGLPRPYTLEDIKLNFRHADEGMLQQINEDRSRAGEWIPRSFKALIAYDLVPTLPLVRCPTLFLYGRNDMLLHKAGILLAGIRGSSMAIMDDAGHLPQVDDPQQFSKLVTAFLNSD